MTLVDFGSLVFLIAFLIAYYVKLWMLQRRFGIKGYVFAKGEKPFKVVLIEILLKITSFIAFIVWALSAFFSGTTWCFARILIDAVFLYIGLFLSGCGVLLFILAMVQMKKSWRVGIDKDTKTELIISGIYKYSRNPAFLGMDIMFIGAVLTYGNLLMILSGCLLIFMLHQQILQEEKHLQQSIGEEYIEYIRKTPRYILLYCCD